MFIIFITTTTTLRMNVCKGPELGLSNEIELSSEQARKNTEIFLAGWSMKKKLSELTSQI